jgi:glycosyltransferase involved in cell wall biosynthesis
MKPSILFVTPYMPYPLNSGGNQGQFHMIDEIRKHYDASMIFEVPETEKNHFLRLQERWPDVRFFPLFKQAPQPAKVKKRPLRKIRRYVKGLFGKHGRKTEPDVRETDFVRQHSTLFCSTFSPVEATFTQHLDQCLSRQNFDIVQVEFYEYLSLVSLLGNIRAKKVFVHHELRYVRNEREMALYKQVSPHDRYLFNVAKQYEMDTLQLYDHVVTVSDVDRELLKQYVQKPVHSSPLIIRREKSTASDVVLKNRIVFIGGFHHFPNRDGMMWFVENCLPIIVAANPDVQLDVIGPGWSHERMNIPHIHLKNYVENISEHITGCIMIVPLRIGSGMRMKIVDGINHACSIVTTTIGVEGIDLVSGVNCLVADSAEDFAGAVIRLLNDPGLRQTMLRNTKEFAGLQRPEEQLKKRLQIYSDILK